MYEWQSKKKKAKKFSKSCFWDSKYCNIKEIKNKSIKERMISMKPQHWITISGVLGLLLILLVANGISPSKTIKPRCANSGCDTIVKNWGEYCYWHKSNHKTDWSTNSASTSPKTRTYESSESSSGSDSSTENSSGTSSQNTSKRWKSDDKYYSYDEGYDDVDMDQDYDENRYANDSEYAEGVDDAIEDAYYMYGDEDY